MKNRDLAEQYFIEAGLMPAREDRTETWLLHHVDVNLKYNDPERYAEWRIEDLQPMPVSAHNTIHKKGITQSEESNRKRSETETGIPKSEEHKKKISIALKGNLDHRGEKNPMWGKKHSDESKQKNAESHRGTHRVYRPDGTWFMER